MLCKAGSVQVSPSPELLSPPNPFKGAGTVHLFSPLSERQRAWVLLGNRKAVLRLQKGEAAWAVESVSCQAGGDPSLPTFCIGVCFWARPSSSWGLFSPSLLHLPEGKRAEPWPLETPSSCRVLPHTLSSEQMRPSEQALVKEKGKRFEVSVWTEFICHSGSFL